MVGVERGSQFLGEDILHTVDRVACDLSEGQRSAGAQQQSNPRQPHRMSQLCQAAAVCPECAHPPPMLLTQQAHTAAMKPTMLKLSSVALQSTCVVATSELHRHRQLLGRAWHWSVRTRPPTTGKRVTANMSEVRSPSIRYANATVKNGADACAAHTCLCHCGTLQGCDSIGSGSRRACRGM